MYRNNRKCKQLKVMYNTYALGGGEWHEQNGINQRGS